ncbi:MAG: hypothetical protein IKI32_01540, partial [Lachnospiraceae bacterium]|nr:hypothetical protein [Lachnospiraceae bacterium]
KRKTKLVPIAVTVFGAGLVLVIFNWIASYFDGVVFFKYWTIEVLIGLIPLRLLVWVGLSIVYTIVGFPITKALLKSCPGGFRQQKKMEKQEAAA